MKCAPGMASFHDINPAMVHSFFCCNATDTQVLNYYYLDTDVVESYDSGFDLPDNGQAGTVGPASQVILDMQNQEITEINKLSQKLPSLSDFLIAYATVPGK